MAGSVASRVEQASVKVGEALELRKRLAAVVTELEDLMGEPPRPAAFSPTLRCAVRAARCLDDLHGWLETARVNLDSMQEQLREVGVVRP